MSQTRRYMVVGESGTGKTEGSADLIDRLRDVPAYRYLVVVSMDTAQESPLADRCAGVVEVTEDVAAADLDLAAVIEAHAGVYFEISADIEGKAFPEFLGRLGRAVMALGDVLLVVDEAAEVTPKAPAEFLACWSRGRKRGVTIIAICQSLKQRGRFGIHPTVVNRSDVLIAYQLSDTKEAEQVAGEMQFRPAVEIVPALATPLDGGEPEFLVADTKLGRIVAYRRAGREALKGSLEKA